MIVEPCNLRSQIRRGVSAPGSREQLASHRGTTATTFLAPRPDSRQETTAYIAESYSRDTVAPENCDSLASEESCLGAAGGKSELVSSYPPDNGSDR